jgi:hypothetical protein
VPAYIVVSFHVVSHTTNFHTIFGLDTYLHTYILLYIPRICIEASANECDLCPVCGIFFSPFFLFPAVSLLLSWTGLRRQSEVIGIDVRLTCIGWKKKTDPGTRYRGMGRGRSVPILAGIEQRAGAAQEIAE